MSRFLFHYPQTPDVLVIYIFSLVCTSLELKKQKPKNLISFGVVPHTCSHLCPPLTLSLCKECMAPDLLLNDACSFTLTSPNGNREMRVAAGVCSVLTLHVWGLPHLQRHTAEKKAGAGVLLSGQGSGRTVWRPGRCSLMLFHSEWVLEVGVIWN